MTGRLRKYPGILLMISAGFLLLLFLLVFCTDLPLGVAGEWIWQRRDAALPEIFMLFLYEVPVFLALAGAAWWLCGRYERWTVKLLIPAALLVLASLHYNTVVWDSGPGQRGENVGAFLDTYTGGYLTQAAKIENPGEFFRTYAARLKQVSEDKAPGHLDVHPPGNVFFSYMVLEFARHVAATEGIVSFLAPPEVRQELKNLAEWKVFADLPDEPAVYDAAVLLLGLANLAICSGLLLILLTVVRLAGRTAQTGGMLWGAFALVYLCGGPVLFTGHYDVFMFFLGALGGYLTVMGMTAERESSRYWFAVLTGFALAVATSCTLAFGALILFAGTAFLLTGRTRRERLALPAVFAAAGLLFVGGLYWLSGVDMIGCLYYALQNHSAFFRETQRSVSGWWLFHLLDMFLFAGPLTMVLMFAALHLPRKVKGELRFRRTPRNIFIALSALFLILLLTSPFGRGEMGRLMLFFMPCCLTAALLGFNLLNRIGIDRRIFVTLLLGNVFLVFVFRVTLKLVMFH